MPPFNKDNILAEMLIPSESTNQIKAAPTSSLYSQISKYLTFLRSLKWVNIILVFYLHVHFLLELLWFPFWHNLYVMMFNIIYACLGIVGVTAGSHRFWCHRSFKATLPLRIYFMLCHTSTGMTPIYDWVRDHRVHHKFTDTNADPYNAKRGFFFSHVGWLFVKKHPDVIEKGRKVDMSDILDDPVVVFQQKYYIPLLLLMGVIVPTIIPVAFFGADWSWSFLVGVPLRYFFILHLVWSVNSVAHTFGTRPFDGGVSASDNFAIALYSYGESWHNFHHTFPWSYKFSRLDGYSLDTGSYWIEMFEKIGWAYDLKVPSMELIKKVAKRNGDGSSVWGGDMEIPESAELAVCCNRFYNTENDEKSR